jgi:hypothetical protein
VAPALHSLIICEREDVADILEFIKHKPVGIRKLILERCSLGEDSTVLLTNIVASYPDLEGLSLDGCHSLTSTDYRLIPCLKKLYELSLSGNEVHYMCVKLLETRVCICVGVPTYM